MDKEVFKVNPIVIYPQCILNNGKQFDCNICANKENCISYQPRCMCIRPYKNHKNGCPNFGKLPTCPPLIPCMYDQIFDISDVYAVVTKFNLENFIQKRREKRPDLAEGQIRNTRVWQPITKKENDYAISELYQENPLLKDYVSTRLIECMGVDVIKTMNNVVVNIEFPPKEYVYRIAFLAKVYQEALDKYGFDIYEEARGLKRGIKTLVKKK